MRQAKNNFLILVVFGFLFSTNAIAQKEEQTELILVNYNV
jgi:hypothetical protein